MPKLYIKIVAGDIYITRACSVLVIRAEFQKIYFYLLSPYMCLIQNQILQSIFKAFVVMSDFAHVSGNRVILLDDFCCRRYDTFKRKQRIIVVAGK